MSIDEAYDIDKKKKCRNYDYAIINTEYSRVYVNRKCDILFDKIIVFLSLFNKKRKYGYNHLE